MKYLFLLLLGLLFIPLAEAKTDIQPNVGYELTINTVDLDMVVDLQSVELQALEVQKTIKSQVLIVAIENAKRKGATNQKENLIKLRHLSNTGKFTNLAYNYSETAPNQVKFKIPFGLRSTKINSQIV